VAASRDAAHRAPPSLGGTLLKCGSASLVPRRHLITRNASISLIRLMSCASLRIPCLVPGPDILWRIVSCRWIRCCISAARCVRHRAPSRSSATLRQIRKDILVTIGRKLAGPVNIVDLRCLESTVPPGAEALLHLAKPRQARPLILGYSHRHGQLVDGSHHSHGHGFRNVQLVMAATDVLNKCVPGDDDSGCVIRFRTAHRS
jgi:hypothetical protein